MISVIICSINDARFSASSAQLASLLKDEAHEIIRIPDARSLGEGYTRGIAASRGEYLIFCHDDIEILNPDFASRLKKHLANFDLVGVAGTTRLISPEWVRAGPPYIFGQVAQVHPQGGFLVRFFGIPDVAVGQIQAMDGLFFAARRSVVEKIQFDFKTFDGFHLYDLDFSFAAHLAGFRLAIANDIHILHASWGSQDQAWRHYADRFASKYADRVFRMPMRQFSFAATHVRTRAEMCEVMAEACRVATS